MIQNAQGKTVERDNEGFLLDPSDWDTVVAEAIAREENLELNPQRWQIVTLVREHLEQQQSVPEARVLLRSLREQNGEDQATRKYLYQLFPYGYGQQACKIAGTRKPLKLMLDM